MKTIKHGGRRRWQRRRNFIFQSNPFLATNLKTSSVVSSNSRRRWPYHMIMAVLHSINVQCNCIANQYIASIDCPKLSGRWRTTRWECFRFPSAISCPFFTLHCSSIVIVQSTKEDRRMQCSGDKPVYALGTFQKLGQSGFPCVAQPRWR